MKYPGAAVYLDETVVEAPEDKKIKNLEEKR
jgi:hypothetical protein